MNKKVVFLLLIIISVACNHDEKMKKETDDFYHDTGGFGYKRIPLIKPYEAKMVSDSEWRIRLETTDLLELSIKNVRGINIVDSMICIFSKGGTPIRDTLYNQAWFVIIPGISHEYGFSKMDDYAIFLKKNGINNPPILHELNKAYQLFHQNGGLLFEK